MIRHALDRLRAALDAAWGRVDTRYANALNSAEDEDEDAERPKWADLFGIAPDYLGSQDVNQWLDEQRGEA